jgi:POT family proton-dependent oligopeptide transporter
VVSPLIKKLMHLDTLKDDNAHIAGESEIGEPAAAGVHPAKRLED